MINLNIFKRRIERKYGKLEKFVIETSKLNEKEFERFATSLAYLTQKWEDIHKAIHAIETITKQLP